MRRFALIAAALALGLAACGPAPQTKSKGTTDKDKITNLVDSLATAGRTHNARKICTEILAKQLIAELKSAGGDCVTEMDRAIKDASDYDLRVDSVKVTGPTATARVRQAKSGRVATFSFVKENGNWRASALGG